MVQDAILHGIVAWGLVTFISVYLVITGVGAVIGGALNVVQQGMQSVGSIGSVAPQAADMLSQPEVARILQEAGSGAAADVTRQDLSAALQQFLQEDSEANRQRVVNILTERTQMSEAERDTVAQLEQRYQQMSQGAADVAQEVRRE
jgi:signal transduction histidine kinase